MNKDVQQLLKRCRRQGFAVRFGGTGHYRVTSPSGHTVTVPATPRSGRRAIANTRAALRRIGAQL
jgi:transcriptional/translational regulatory protein YebC/TACO1